MEKPFCSNGFKARFTVANKKQRFSFLIKFRNISYKFFVYHLHFLVAFIIVQNQFILNKLFYFLNNIASNQPPLAKMYLSSKVAINSVALSLIRIPKRFWSSTFSRIRLKTGLNTDQVWVSSW